MPIKIAQPFPALDLRTEALSETWLAQKLLRISLFGIQNFRGGTNRVFGKPCFCPLPKRGHFDENGENDECAFYLLKTSGFALQTPENDENDENGGCHSGKGMV